MNLASDNAAGCSPEMLDALARVNAGRAAAYGADPTTLGLTRTLSAVFEREVAVFPVISGTAANALALASLTPPWGAVLCHADAHVEWDECGAPEVFNPGAKLAPVAGAHGKITPEGVLARLAGFRRGDQHHVQPAAISITQSTEWGTVYSRAEVAALGALAREEGLGLHMDGARFANALVATGASPADLTWRAGVDVLSFGATKNGALAAEALIVFDPARADSLPFRRKRTGHLISKMRFVSAQLDAYVTNDLWRRNAAHANAMAGRLAAGLTALPGVEPMAPVEANALFARLPAGLAQGLYARGHVFYPWGPPADAVYRFVTAFDTDPAEIDGFVADAAAILAEPGASPRS